VYSSNVEDSTVLHGVTYTTPVPLKPTEN